MPLLSCLAVLILALPLASWADGPGDSSPSAPTVRLSNPEIPEFTRLRPRWAVQLTGSANGLAPNNLSATTLSAGGIQFEYEPRFLQSIGVLSLGPSFDIYFDPSGNNTPSAFAVWGIGGQVRYQARFFRDQPFVPMVGYTMEQITYHFSSDGSQGAYQAKGPVFGGYFLLNWLEKSAAADFYDNWGILRSYLVAEVRSLSGGDGTSNVDGTSCFFGLRLEY